MRRFSGHDTIPVDHFLEFVEAKLEPNEVDNFQKAIVDTITKSLRALQKEWEARYILEPEYGEGVE